MHGGDRGLAAGSGKQDRGSGDAKPSAGGAAVRRDPRTAGGNVEREASPGPTATPAPTLQPTPSPTPEETPEAVVYSMRVTISPRSLSLFLPAPQGTNAPGYPGAASLSAEVLMSDASTNSSVTWSSSNEAVVTVDSAGSVRSEKATGSARITATAADNRTTDRVDVTVAGAGDLEVEVR